MPAERERDPEGQRLTTTMRGQVETRSKATMGPPDQQVGPPCNPDSQTGKEATVGCGAQGHHRQEGNARTNAVRGEGPCSD